MSTTVVLTPLLSGAVFALATALAVLWHRVTRVAELGEFAQVARERTDRKLKRLEIRVERPWDDAAYADDDEKDDD